MKKHKHDHGCWDCRYHNEDKPPERCYQCISVGRDKPSEWRHKANNDNMFSWKYSCWIGDDD